MKIDISSIIRDHIRTLKNDQTGKISNFDIILFYATPLFISGAVVWEGLILDKDAYSISITFFGIFIALLLNIQVAIFSIHQKRRSELTEVRIASIQKDRADLRDELLSELNSNISYLVLFSCICLIIFLCLYLTRYVGKEAVAISIILYSHFILVLLMVIKRSHALFQSEYIRDLGI